MPRGIGWLIWCLAPFLIWCLTPIVICAQQENVSILEDDLAVIAQLELLESLDVLTSEDWEMLAEIDSAEILKSEEKGNEKEN